MNAGIITFYYQNYNFGGQLQAFALCASIRRLGVNCEQISYTNIPVSDLFQKAGFKSFARKLLKFPVSKAYKGKIDHRIKAYQDFSKLIPHSRVYQDFDDLKSNCLNYDCYICGGDQIWNDWGFNIDVFTLAFVSNDKRKVAYAPSLGNGSLQSQFLHQLAERITRLDYISVREKSTQQLVHDLTSKSVVAVLDPVLLCNKIEWDILSKGKVYPKFRYAFCYLLGTNRIERVAAGKYAHKNKLKLYTLPFSGNNTPIPCDLFFGDIRDFTSGPAEFVGLIKNAECVITDSFHAIVFSLIYHKPFYVFERNTQVGGGTMNSRIYDFLDEFGLRDRLVTPEQLMKKQTIEPINYTYADSVLERRRKESFDYLKTALGIHNN